MVKRSPTKKATAKKSATNSRPRKPSTRKSTSSGARSADAKKAAKKANMKRGRTAGTRGTGKGNVKGQAKGVGGKSVSPTSRKNAKQKAAPPNLEYINTPAYERDLELEVQGNSAAREVIRAGASRKQTLFLRPAKIFQQHLTSPGSGVAPTEEITRAMCLLVRAGNYPIVAARAVGVSMMIFNRWIEEALKDPNSAYGKWFRAVDAADAEDECIDMARIGLMPKNWQALAFKRSGKSAGRWGQRVQHTMDVIAETQTQAALPELSIDEQSEVFTILEKAGYFDKPQIIDAKAEEAEAPSGVNGKAKS